MPFNELRVIKVPLGRPIISKDPHFPPLNNLELNLLENPELLKSSAPLIPVKPIRRVNKIQESDNEDYSRSYNKDSKRARREEDELAKEFGGGSDDESDDGDDDGDSGEDSGGEDDESGEEESGDDEGESGDESDEYDEEGSDDEEEEESDVETPEEREERERSEYIRKLKILKKQYPDRNIPDFNEYTDLKTLKRRYEDERFDIDADQSLETYRVFLLVSWVFMEFVATKWLHMDMGGLANYHVSRIQKYDRLLIELGEKSYSKFGASLPVEVRLIGLILFDSLVFFVLKQMSSSGDTSNMGALLSMFNMNPSQQQAPKGVENPKTSRIREPSITPDQIREMAS